MRENSNIHIRFPIINIVFNLFCRLNRKLKGVVYNPMAMEYTTKWHQPVYPKRSKPKSSVDSQPTNVHDDNNKGVQISGGNIHYDTFGLDKSFGKLTLKELVERLERLRRESPFAEDFKMNDPFHMQTVLTSQSSSDTTSLSSDLSSNNSSIHVRPVIPDMNLSTPVFEQPRRVKKVIKRDNDKASKTLSKPFFAA